MEECEREFMEMKQFMSTPPVLVRPKENSPITLYLEVSERVVSSLLV